MTDAADVDAVELISVRASQGARSLRLKIRDRNGKAMTMSLPADWLGAMLATQPWSFGGDAVHQLASWSIDRTAGEDLVLTLRTAEGLAVSFAMKPWQISGMATIATYGNTAALRKEPLH